MYGSFKYICFLFICQDGPFSWDKELQGVILGSFFWGYLLTQVLGGWLAGRYGGKRILGYSMLVTAIATLLTPVASYGSPYGLMALRFINGLGEVS
jgi:ACS family sodium-dependent inorganic phosphate cotransporter-like MFS transporter 5